MALTLGNRPKAGERRTRRMDTDFAAVEHPHPQDVAVLDRPGPDNLGKERQADPHQAAGLAGLEISHALSLFSAQCVIVHRLQRLVPCGVIVP